MTHPPSQPTPNPLDVALAQIQQHIHQKKAGEGRVPSLYELREWEAAIAQALASAAETPKPATEEGATAAAEPKIQADAKTLKDAQRYQTLISRFTATLLDGTSQLFVPGISGPSQEHIDAAVDKIGLAMRKNR